MLQCHYSSEKGAAFMGFGTDSVVFIKTNDNGAMLIDDLVMKIKENTTEVQYLLLADVMLLIMMRYKYE